MFWCVIALCNHRPSSEDFTAHTYVLGLGCFCVFVSFGLVSKACRGLLGESKPVEALAPVSEPPLGEALARRA